MRGGDWLRRAPRRRRDADACRTEARRLSAVRRETPARQRSLAGNEFDELPVKIIEETAHAGLPLRPPPGGGS
jgi:hypothetical protein